MEAFRTIRVHALISSLTWGGAEMLLSDFAAGAPTAGIELSVGFLEDRDGNPAAARLRSQGIEPILAQIRGPRPMLSRSDHCTVRRHLADVRPDVLHTHLGYADMLGGVAARSLKIPTVSTLHTMGWKHLGRSREYAKERLMALVRRRCIGRVITVSEAARRAYLETGWDRPDRVVTVHNGVAIQPRPGAGRAVRSELGLGSDDLVVAMVTVLRPGKGHDVAVAAVRALHERFPHLKLLIVGDGPGRAEVERLAAPIGPAAVLTGHRDDVAAVLDAADVLLHPTLIDAFPTVLMEGMAAGVPIVATAVGGIPEIVEHGRTGMLIDSPPDPERVAGELSPLLESAELRSHLGARGRERFEREFTAESWARRLRPIYDAALSR
jgi:glycosyltransferase involved in cell wall biosynthesis